MSILKSLVIASMLIAGASQLAFAQTSQGGANGSPATNAQSSGGSGTHVGAQKTGSASNDEKVLKNQNGYQGGKQ
jgi:hypothetical protein